MDDTLQKILEIVTDTQDRVGRMEADIQFIKTEIRDI